MVWPVLEIYDIKNTIILDNEMWYNQFNHVLLSMLSPHSTKLLVLHVYMYFLPQYLNAMLRVPPQKVEAITVCYWRRTEEQSRVTHDAPAFIADVGSHHVYGMPAIEYPDLCKVQPHPPPPPTLQSRF